MCEIVQIYFTHWSSVSIVNLQTVKCRLEKYCSSSVAVAGTESSCSVMLLIQHTVVLKICKKVRKEISFYPYRTQLYQ